MEIGVDLDIEMGIDIDNMIEYDMYVVLVLVLVHSYFTRKK